MMTLKEPKITKPRPLTREELERLIDADGEFQTFDEQMELLEKSGE